jgi:hypothetical protein
MKKMTFSESLQILTNGLSFDRELNSLIQKIGALSSSTDHAAINIAIRENNELNLAATNLFNQFSDVSKRAGWLGKKLVKNRELMISKKMLLIRMLIAQLSQRV